MMVRWWWFGPAVTHAEIEREMKLMKEGGIGGFEVQPTYPLSVDGELPGVKNLKFMSPEFLEALKFTAAKAKEMGLRMDLTLGSGWPYGGPQFSNYEGAGRLDTSVVNAPEGAKSVNVPALREGQTLMAAFVAPANSGLGGRGGGGGRGGRGGRGGGAGGGGFGPDASGLKQAKINGSNIELPEGTQTPCDVICFIAGQTGMQVKRPAYGAEGNVIDHFSAPVVDKFIAEIAEPAIAACMPNAPFSVFCDSLEVQGENWSPQLLEEFKKRRGYDLTPLLPALIGDFGPKTGEIRHDWMMTCTEMFNENFNGKFKKLAEKYGTKFRIQGYGSPPAALYSYAYADMGDGEGFTWQGFSTSRWAASSNHLLNRTVTSSETWTWLHGLVFRGTPMDIKAEADRHVLEGVNQFIAHGWPYTAEGASYPGWSFYAAGVFDQYNPWWIVMPDLTKYLQRISYMARQGTPANDVLVFLPNSDAWASGNASMNAALGGRAGNVTTPLLAAGYNVDYCDDQLLEMRGKVDGKTIAFGDSKYKAVVLTSSQRVQLSTMKKLEEFAKAGGIVIAAGGIPEIAPGYLTPAADTDAVKQISAELFSGDHPLGIRLDENGDLAGTLAKKLPPDASFSMGDGEIGFVHRHTADADVYFIANTSNQDQAGIADIRMAGMQVEQWNPMTGTAVGATLDKPGDATRTRVQLKLAPYESTILVFSKRALPQMAAAPTSTAGPIDLTANWTAKFGDEPTAVKVDKLGSWADDEAHKNFSGVVTYERTFTIAPNSVPAGATMMLNFGQGTVPQGGGGRGGQGFHVNYDPPVREACIVYINDQRIGSLWTPPYSLNVGQALKAGENKIKIEVANTALNKIAGSGQFPNYNLQAVRAQFGNRFDPQGLNAIQVLPSGLTGTVQLMPGAAK